MTAPVSTKSASNTLRSSAIRPVPNGLPKAMSAIACAIFLSRDEKIAMAHSFSRVGRSTCKECCLPYKDCHHNTITSTALTPTAPADVIGREPLMEILVQTYEDLGELERGVRCSALDPAEVR
jgi:hypothetical protein